MMFRPTALIHTDALRREYPANWTLAKSLEAAGYKVILSSRSSTQRLLRFFTPDVVILSHVFSLTERELESLHKRGARIFSNEVEGEIEGNEFGISGTYPRDVAYQYFEKIFTWSEWSARWLVRERQIDPARVRATGSIRLSLLRHFRSHAVRRRIGILSRFETINTFDGRHPFENLMSMDYFGMRSRGYLERTVVEMDSFAITCQVIESLIRKGLAVTIRPHPNEAIDAYQLLKRKYGPLLDVDSSTDYMGWLQGLSVVVGTLSSAYTEPYLLGIPIVSLEGLQEKNYQSVPHLIPFMETFSRACYRPADLGVLLDLCADPQLAPIHNMELKQQLSAIYSLANPDDPINSIVASVGRTDRTAYSISALLVKPAKFLLDVLAIASCVLKKNPKLAFRAHVIYNYNTLLHRPSSFMRTLIAAGAAKAGSDQAS